MDKSVPIVIEHADIPFNKIAVAMSFSPRFIDGGIQISVSMEAEPYRILPDGKYQPYGEKTYRESAMDIKKDAETDPAKAAMLQAFMAAIQTYIQAKQI